jgi:hypothetical protein
MPSHQVRQNRRVEHEARPVLTPSIAAPTSDVIQREVASDTGQNITASLENTGTGQSLDGSTCEYLEPKFGHDFANIKIHADGHGEAQSSDPQRPTIQRDPLPAVPNYQLNTTFGQPQDPASRYHLGGDLTLHLDPQLQASIQLHARRSFDPSLISSGIAGLGRGFPALTAATPSPTAAPAAATSPTPGSTTPAPSPSPTPRTPEAAPELPHPGSVGDIFSAFASYAVIQQALDRLKEQAASQALRDWNRLRTGERILVVTSGIVIAAPALGFSIADPTMRAHLGSILNGTPLPVPGVPWLHLETNLQADSFMVGLHVDLGSLLAPVLPGFGAGSPTAIGDPPSPVQREKSLESSPMPDIGSKINARLGSGAPIEDQTRQHFSSNFGHDFSQVRIHHDGEANQLSKAVNARAFTTGQDIFFSEGMYNPHSSDGQKLLAHELTHTVQQARGSVAGTPTAGGVSISDPSDAFEQEAVAKAETISSGGQVVVGSPTQNVQRLMDSNSVGGLYLQRDPQPSAPPTSTPGSSSTTNPSGSTSNPINASMFTVEGSGAPNLTGNVSARRSGDDVIVESPDVIFNATVTMRADAVLNPDEQVKVGPVQTLLSSDRVAVYRQGGIATGKVIAEKHILVGQVRDAQTKRGTATTPDVLAPWYSRPKTIDGSHRQETVSYKDKPDFETPFRIDDGQLTETRGSDQFITSLAVQKNDQLLHLQTSHWEVPWKMNLNTSGVGTGGVLTGGSVTGAPPTISGPIAAQAAQEWMAFGTVETAMTVSNRILLNSLIPAKEHDKAAWHNIVEALRRKNPMFSLVFTVHTTDSSFGGDALNLTARGHRAVTRDLGSLNNRQTANVSFGLNELFDPMTIESGSVCNIEISNHNLLGNDSTSIPWVYPFVTQDTPKQFPKKGTERYTITGGLT